MQPRRQKGADQSEGGLKQKSYVRPDQTILLLLHFVFLKMDQLNKKYYFKKQQLEDVSFNNFLQALDTSSIAW